MIRKKRVKNSSECFIVLIVAFVGLVAVFSVVEFNVKVSDDYDDNLYGQAVEGEYETTKYYVAPYGNDNNPGTFDYPFRTLEKARDTIRNVNDDMQEDIIIFLMGGTYYLDETLVLDDQDSGTNGFNIIYTNYAREVPVISGGKEINDWVQEGDTWKAYLGTDFDTRQLYVNGVRAIRARSDFGLPNAIKTEWGYIDDFGEVMQNWENVNYVEFVDNVEWCQFRCGVESVSGKNIVIKQPCWDLSQQGPTEDYYFPIMNEPVWIENAYELLDSPGEWYLNRKTGWIYYMPRSGEIIDNVETIVPVLDVLLEGHDIHNIHFKGLTFSHTTYLKPNSDKGCVMRWITGCLGRGQITSGIGFMNSEFLVFERNTFTHLGGTALRFAQVCKGNRITGNHFYDVSGSGIKMGQHTEDPLLVSKHNIISNNYIHNVGNEYMLGVGIEGRTLKNATIEHNEITDTPYSGIIVSKNRAGSSSLGGKNKVFYNLVHDHMKVLWDGGGIYSNGVQWGDDYSYNVVKNQHHDYGAIYLDDNSMGKTVSNNVIFDNKRTIVIKGGTLNIHDNWWQDRGLIENFQGFLIGDIMFRDNDVCQSCENGECVDISCGDITMENNHNIASLDEAPAWILDNAGLEAEYADIKEPKVSQTPDRLLNGDFNGDEIEDTLFCYQSDLDWDVMLGGSPDINTWFHGFGMANKELIADLNGDDLDDFVVIIDTKGGWVWHVGLSDGTKFIKRANALTGLGIRDGVDVCDYDEDGSDELIVYSDTNYCLKFNTPTNKLDSEECSLSCNIVADLNDDGEVNILDLVIVTTDFGKTSGFDPLADTDDSGEVDIFDVVFVASRFS